MSFVKARRLTKSNNITLFHADQPHKRRDYRVSMDYGIRGDQSQSVRVSMVGSPRVSCDVCLMCRSSQSRTNSPNRSVTSNKGCQQCKRRKSSSISSCRSGKSSQKSARSKQTSKEYPIVILEVDQPKPKKTLMKSKQPYQPFHLTTNTTSSMYSKSFNITNKLSYHTRLKKTKKAKKPKKEKENQDIIEPQDTEFEIAHNLMLRFEKMLEMSKVQQSQSSKQTSIMFTVEDEVETVGGEPGSDLEYSVSEPDISFVD